MTVVVIEQVGCDVGGIDQRVGARRQNGEKGGYLTRQHKRPSRAVVCGSSGHRVLPRWRVECTNDVHSTRGEQALLESVKIGHHCRRSQERVDHRVKVNLPSAPNPRRDKGIAVLLDGCPRMGQ